MVIVQYINCNCIVHQYIKYINQILQVPHLIIDAVTSVELAL